MPVHVNRGTYVDTGTGAVQNPTEPRVHTNDGVHLGEVDLKTNKGVVPLKTNEPHTYEKHDHEDKPTSTGAYTWRPEATSAQHPHPEAAPDKAAKKPHKK